MERVHFKMMLDKSKNSLSGLRFSIILEVPSFLGHINIFEGNPSGTRRILSITSLPESLVISASIIKVSACEK